MTRISWRPVIALAIGVILCNTPTQAGWEIGDMAEIMDSSLRLKESAGAPDGMGGMLLMAIDQGGSPNRVSVTRVDHTGTEVWGDNGFWLPAIVGDLPSILLPTAVASDGVGGGYFAYHAARDGNDYLLIAYVDASGSYQWTRPIDNLGLAGTASDVAVQLVPADSGTVIVIFTRDTGGPIHYSACVDQAGTILWHGPVNDSWGWDSYAIATSDGMGGAFVAYWRDGVTDEVRIQRLVGTTGTRVWGTDGALVWTNYDFVDIVRDGAGGAYLVRDLVGIAYAQHVNSSGVKTWGSDVVVHDTHTAYFALSTQARLCVDGSGGFILFHGLEDMFAQRVDINGTLLWGGGVTVATVVNIGAPRTIAPDGFGGAIVTYENNWLIPSSTEQCDQVNGARIDAFGTLVWTDYLDWCHFNNTPSGPDINEVPHTARAFADGSGGGMFAWLIDDVDGSGDDLMWGKGVDASGEQPTPRATFFQPDNAEPGASGPYLILGDYLDLSLGYTIEKETGSPSQTIGPTDFYSYQMVGGTTTLTGLTSGAYHLKIDDGGTLMDTFEYAVGIGYPLSCQSESTVLGVERSVDLGGSQRQSTWVADGMFHAFWIEYRTVSPHYRLNWLTWNGAWWFEHRSPYSSDAPLEAPTVTSDPAHRLHLAFVEEIDATHDRLRYMQLGEEGDVFLHHYFEPGEVIRNPVIAWTENDRAHVVMERGASPGNDLLHVQDDGGGFDTGVNPTTTGSPRTPDLAAMGAGLELIWAGDSAIPGIQTIERATYTDSWSAPQLVSFGLVMTSPTVAWDGAGETLYAWIIDNELVNGIPPLVHSQLRIGDEFLDVRARPGWPEAHTVSVASPSAGRFVMFTSESEGGPVIRIVGREGDGKVFFPRLQVNAGTDVQDPRFAVQRGGNGLNAYWRSFASATTPVMGTDCEITATSAPGADVVVDLRLIGRPNPFNPLTHFEFELGRRTYVVLEIFDLRGRLVKSLFRGELESGPQAIAWDGTDDAGVEIASGTYLVRLRKDDGSTAVTKVAMLK